ncbi:MAG: hypothetical protein ACK5NA_09010 [Enterococcus sp.]
MHAPNYQFIINKKRKLTVVLITYDMNDMVAISMKSFMDKLFAIALKNRLLPTLLLECLMIKEGGRVWRVHHVEQTKMMLELLKIYDNES